MGALSVIYAIWLRESTLFLRERTRIIGMVGQPLLYLVVMGTGIAAGMRLNVAGEIDYLKFMYPGILAMSVLFTGIFSAMSIIWDREFGFLKEVLVAPVPRWGVAVGKSLGGATVATVQAAILILLAPLVGVTLSPGILLQLLAIAFLISFAMTSLGVAIAARMSSMQGFQMILNFLVMPMFFLSGGMFPIDTAPAWMKSLMVVNPLSYGVDALRNVVFSGTVLTLDGARVPLAGLARDVGILRWSLSHDVGVILAVAALLAVVGTLAFARAEQ